MDKTSKSFSWLQAGAFFLISLLTAEVVLLTLQNRDLKNKLKSTAFAAQVDPLAPGEKAVPFKIQTLDGATNELAFSDPAKKSLLFVLSTTCPHCEKTLANWKTITEKSLDDRCNIIGVSIHNLEETRKYLTNKKVGFYMVSAAADTGFSRKYKISGVPETILIDGNGSVEKVWLGELSDEQTEEIEKLMSA